MKFNTLMFTTLLAGGAFFAAPAAAQDESVAQGPYGPPSETVFDGDWVSIGIGGGYGPSYAGSDDYVFFPLPIIQGSLGGVDIQPRPAGLALDFIPDAEGAEVNFAFGPSFRLRSDRADQIEDPVVKLAGELDRAFEIGPSASVSLPGLLNPFDSLTLTTDVRWDVAGAHSGMVVEPSVTYFTPLSRAAIASLSLSTRWVDDDFAEYYYTVSPEQSLASGLPLYDADSGFASAGVNLLLGYDFDGDATNGGLAGIAILGYSHQLGDAKDTPYTSIRGDADQFLVGLGIGYTF